MTTSSTCLPSRVTDEQQDIKSRLKGFFSLLSFLANINNVTRSIYFLLRHINHLCPSLISIILSDLPPRLLYNPQLVQLPEPLSEYIFHPCSPETFPSSLLNTVLISKCCFSPSRPLHNPSTSLSSFTSTSFLHPQLALLGGFEFSSAHCLWIFLSPI